MIEKSKARCTVEGCQKWLVRRNLCTQHFEEKYGVRVCDFKKGKVGLEAKSIIPAGQPIASTPEIWERFKQARKACGKSNVQIGKDGPTSTTYIQKIKDCGNLSYGLWGRFAHALDVKVDWLLYGDKEDGGITLDATQTVDSQAIAEDKKEAVGRSLHQKPNNDIKKVSETYRVTICGYPTTLKFKCGENGDKTVDDVSVYLPSGIKPVDSSIGSIALLSNPVGFWREALRAIDEIEGRR